MPDLSGVICAAVTPLAANLEPDLAAVVAHLGRLLQNGCDGINLLGTTGEATSFSVDQRLAVMRAVAASGLPLRRFMVGTGAASLADAVALTGAACELGFAGSLVVPPFYYKPVGDAGVAAYYRALVERVADERLRLYFYHFPQMTGIEIRAEVIADVDAAFPGTVAGVKDSSGDVAYARELVARFPHLAIFPSTEAYLLDAAAEGFAGCISATVNVSASLAGAIWHRRAADPVAAQRELTAIRSILARYPLVPAIRATLAELADDAAWERVLAPLAPLANEQRRELREALAANPGFASLATTARA